MSYAAAGAGKYDDLCTHVREQAMADAAIVIIRNGTKGDGFSVQCGGVGVYIETLASLPDYLEFVAKAMREQLKAAQ